VVTELMVAWWSALSTLAADGADSFELGTLAQYGVLGLAAGALAVFARVAYRREVERADRLEAEVVRLNNLIVAITERTIPALAAAASSAEEANLLVRELQRDRERDLLRGSPPPRSRARQGDDRP
jgi:hypothetical protein